MTDEPLDALLDKHHLVLAERAHAAAAREDASWLAAQDWQLLYSLLLRAWANGLRAPADAAGVQTTAPEKVALAEACGRFFACDGAPLHRLVNSLGALRSASLQLLPQAASQTDVRSALLRFDALVDESIGMAAEAFVAELNRHRNRSLHRLGHDLRSQLNVIAMIGEALGRPQPGPDTPPYAEKIQRSSERLTLLLDVLHGITLGHGPQSDLPLCNGVSGCWEMARNLRNDEGIRLAWKGPPVVLGHFDSALVSEAVAHLIRLVAEPLRANRAVRVEVTHNGPAVVLVVRGDDAQPALPDALDAPAVGGHTPVLPMMAARQIARRHGGELQPEGDAGGPGFRMVLPAQPAS